MKCSVFLALLQLTVAIVCKGLDDPGADILIACARASAWAAAINFGFVALGILSPILQLVYQLFNFNIVHHSFHKIHFHRNVASCGCIFSLLHVILLAAFTIKNKDGCHQNAFCQPLPLISGGLIILGVAGAWLTGYLTRLKKFSFLSVLHFPLACIAFFGLFAHATKTVEPFGTNFVLVTFITCLIIYAIFFFFNPIQPMDINKTETTWYQEKTKFAFLVINCHNSGQIPPGSFFLIYSNNNSNLSHFHAHAFPVFSSKNQRITFLIRTRTSKHPTHITFTQQLCTKIYPNLFFSRLFFLFQFFLSVSFSFSC